MAKNQHPWRKKDNKIGRWMSVRQKLGMILVIKWFKNWHRKKCLNQKMFSRLILTNDFFLIWSIFDIKNWLWKYDFDTFWQTVIHQRICFFNLLYILAEKSIIKSTLVCMCLFLCLLLSCFVCTRKGFHSWGVSSYFWGINQHQFPSHWGD